MSTLAEVLRSDSSIALIHPGDKSFQLSYAQLNHQINQFKDGLVALGIGHGQAVSIAIPNSVEFAVSFLATTSLGAIAAPLNPAYKQSEFEFYIDDLNSSLVLIPQGTFDQNTAAVKAARTFNASIAEIHWNGHQVALDMKEKGRGQHSGLETPSKANPDDVALVLHTSGTTGRPKAVPLTHSNLITTMHNVQKTYNLSPNDRTYLVMPLFHVHGLLAGFLAPLFSGGSVIIPLRFSISDFWKHFTVHKANWYTAVPTIHQIILKSPLPSPIPLIRFIRSCSSPLSPTVLLNLEKALKAPVLEAYAMTEASHQITSNPLPPANHIPGSVGIGHGVEIRILDQNGQEVPNQSEGEICIRGQNVTKGYLNNPAANESSYFQNGFFKTGDQGKMDQNGYIYITGRIKELINKGGEKISPIELDNLLVQHPNISEAVSFAIDDDVYGQNIGVAIVLKPKHHLSSDQLIGWMSEKVVKFKLPARVFFTNIMPKTATGKIQRKNVAEAMLKQSSREQMAVARL